MFKVWYLYWGQASTANTLAVGAEMLKVAVVPAGVNWAKLQDISSTAYVQQAGHGLQSQNVNLKESLSVLSKGKALVTDQLPHSIS